MLASRVAAAPSEATPCALRSAGSPTTPPSAAPPFWMRATTSGSSSVRCSVSRLEWYFSRTTWNVPTMALPSRLPRVCVIENITEKLTRLLGEATTAPKPETKVGPMKNAPPKPSKNWLMYISAGRVRLVARESM